MDTPVRDHAGNVGNQKANMLNLIAPHVLPCVGDPSAPALTVALDPVTHQPPALLATSPARSAADTTNAARNAAIRVLLAPRSADGATLIAKNIFITCPTQFRTI